LLLLKIIIEVALILHEFVEVKCTLVGLLLFLNLLIAFIDLNLFLKLVNAYLDLIKLGLKLFLVFLGFFE